MTSERPRVDVAIPCYNYAHYLPTCVQSIIEQPGVDVRVLIIDDASPDDTAEVAQELVARHPNVEYHRHSTNLGHIRTFNDGVDWATAEFFVLISADDLLTPGSLQRSTDALRKHPSAGLVYGPVVIFDGDPPPFESAGSHRVELTPGGTWIRRRCVTGENAAASPEVMVRTEVQQAAGRYEPSVPHNSDFLMWLRIAARSDVARITGVPQAYYRRHSANMSELSSLRASALVLDLEERWSVFERLFDTPDLSAAEVGRWRTAARRALADDALGRASRLLDRSDGEVPDSAALVAFAAEVYPGWKRMPAGMGYRCRRWLGPGRMTWLPPFLAGRAVRRGKATWRRSRGDRVW